MKHAGKQTLLTIEPLLKELREVEGLKEKKLGIFYHKSRAFLHFHEDGERIFADVRLSGPDFDRLPCTTYKERRALIVAIKHAVPV